MNCCFLKEESGGIGGNKGGALGWVGGEGVLLVVHTQWWRTCRKVFSTLGVVWYKFREVEVVYGDG